MSSLKLILFMGSARPGRLGERVLKFVQNKLNETNHEVTLFDPTEMEFGVLKQPLHFYPDQSQAPDWLREAGDKISKADGYFLISPEYNASIPPPLSTMMDHFPPTFYSFKPAAICTYSPGIFGGIRCNVALRSFLAELGCIGLPAGMSISHVNKALDADGKPLIDTMDPRINRLIKHLEWYGEATKNQRKKGVPQ